MKQGTSACKRRIPVFFRVQLSAAGKPVKYPGVLLDPARERQIRNLEDVFRRVAHFRCMLLDSLDDFQDALEEPSPTAVPSRVLQNLQEVFHEASDQDTPKGPIHGTLFVDCLSKLVLL